MTIIPFPIGSFIPYYIKKEDARDIPLNQRKFVGIFIISLSLSLAALHFTVWPKLQELLLEFNVQNTTLASTESISSLTMGIIVAGLIIGGYFLATQPNFTKLNPVIKKYKKGEMIKTKEIIDPSASNVAIITALIMFSYMVLTFILPIYTLTNSL